MKVKLIARTLILFGALAIIADIANLFPDRPGAYAIAGAVLIAAGILVRADN